MKDAKKYVERYYKGKEVTSITTQPNMLGEPMFEVVKFNNGDYITLARSVNGELFRHSSQFPCFFYLLIFKYIHRLS